MLRQRVFSEFPSSSCPGTKWLSDPFTEAGLSGVAARLPPKGERTEDRLLGLAGAEGQ